MDKVRLGKTGIVTNKNGFGALPIQRTDEREAVRILKTAYENGITFYDTARFYTDSEHKLGLAFSDIRHHVFISSKTMAKDPDSFFKDLDETLTNLNTDYLDLYQFHNPDFCPKPGDGSGLYECMLKAKEEGKILHIGITNHRLTTAQEAVDSGLYETLQFPFSYLATEEEEELVKSCEEADMGFLAMKSLSGGLITSSAAAYAFASCFDNVLPIWGIQRMDELMEFISYQENPPALTGELRSVIEKDRMELMGDFCRGCGYCMPCPAGIEINNCARMSLLIRRSPSEQQLTPEVQEKMMKIEDCRHCNRCRSRCPYHLDTPALLERNLKDYKEILAGKPIRPIHS